ncbi:disulfide isomerase [Microthyrium microscopicum]|uniref:Disulfide isomerase n=1 Tax=Microthyrium microscopicum TaxID=703497 RepID=A0A6A6UKP2_9PEZI|nr:disulfide isomerase [Microthyrium microscopicum]
MRLSWLLSLAVLAAPLWAATVEAPAESPEDASTKFNGIEVPAMKQLRGDQVDETIASGHWLVEYYSPYCGHCQALAPILQTLYEYYYTSKPVGAPSSSTDEGLNSFSGFYKFKFAKLDCVAFADGCVSHKVESWPTLAFYKDGKEVKRSVGTKQLPELSKWLEEILESIKPGSRLPEGPILPKVGDHEAPAGAKTVNPDQKDKDPAAGKAAGSKHNSIAAATATGAPKVVDKNKPVPNPQGTSTHLTQESFQRLVTTTRDPWFVKFYAPWCHHCQAMGPNWMEMSREMKGSLNIGEVNCDLEKRLCKDAKVKGFPTLLFFRGGERVEYNGLRGVGDLIGFAKKAIDVGMGVDDVDNAQFKKLEETEEVIFTYFYDHATTSEDFAALQHLTLSLIGHGKLVKTNDPKLAERYKISTWPRLVVSRDGKPSYYPYLAPKDMRDYRQILTWMKTVWQPLVPELTASNAREIMSNSIVVLGVLSRARSDEFIIARREMKSAAIEWIDRETHLRQLERQELRDAKQLRIEEAEDRGDDRAKSRARGTRIFLEPKPEVKFAWVDGIFWQRWIKTTYGVDVADGEKVVIIDEDNKRYWDTTMTGNPIVPSRTSILETIPRVLANPPKIPPKSSASTIGTVFYRVRSTWRQHPWFSTLLLVGFLIGSYVIARRFRRRPFGSGGWINLDGEKGAFGNGASKVD